MYDNIYLTEQNLRRPAKIYPGGLCKAAFFRIQDVDEWPEVDPADDCIKDPISLKVGATLYVIEATEKEKTYTETTKSGEGGEYVEMEVITNLAGFSPLHHAAIKAMMFNQFGLIVWDRDGNQRLVGNRDAGARISNRFTSGDSQNSRYRFLSFKYNHQLPAPIYLGGTVMLDNQNSIFEALTLVDRFRVDAPGAPMDDGDTIYQNAALANASFIMLADGKAIHQMSDDPEQRYASKTFESDTITVNGGVTENEVIEIYKF